MQKYSGVWRGNKQRVTMQVSILGFLGAICSQPEQESICHSYGCLENKYSFRSAASDWYILLIIADTFYF